MGPVDAKARRAERDDPAGGPPLADGEAAHVTVSLGMADEHPDALAVSCSEPDGGNVEAGLEAKKVAVDFRRERTAAMIVGARAEGAPPGSSKAAAAGQQGLLVVALVEGAEGLKADEAGQCRQSGVDHRLGSEERNRLPIRTWSRPRRDRAGTGRLRTGCWRLGFRSGDGPGSGSGPGGSGGTGATALRRQKLFSDSGVPPFIETRSRSMQTRFGSVRRFRSWLEQVSGRLSLTSMLARSPRSAL
jgi:hypothetical protein